MAQPVSLIRLYLMRALYLILCVGLGSSVWPGIIHRNAWSDPLQAVAVCFWAALSLLAALGIRYPLKMLPLLLLQLAYKSIWLVAVGLPLHSAGKTSGLMPVMLMGVAFDLICIPWVYLFESFIKSPGDRWK